MVSTSVLNQHKPLERYLSSRNKRNDYSERTVRTTNGAFTVNMPRDHNRGFTSGLFPKYVRMFSDLEEKVFRLYAVGTSTRDISELLTGLYHAEINSLLVSAITDRVLEDVQQWQSCPLDDVYSVMIIDALHVKIRHEGTVKAMRSTSC